MRIADCGGEFGEKLNKKFLGISGLVFREPRSSPLVALFHIEADSEPAGILTPRGSLPSSALDQFQLLAELAVDRPALWRFRHFIAMLRRQTEIDRHAIENFDLGKRTHVNSVAALAALAQSGLAFRSNILQYKGGKMGVSGRNDRTGYLALP